MRQASKPLTNQQAEQPEDNKITNPDSLRYNSMLNIKSAYYNFKYAEEFIDTNSFLINRLTAEELEVLGQVNADKSIGKIIGGIYRDFSAGLQVMDLRKQEIALPPPVVQILTGMELSETIDSLLIRFPLNGMYNLCLKKQRGGVTYVKDLMIRPETSFRIRNKLEAYGNERYSIGISTLDNEQTKNIGQGSFGFGLICQESTSGLKIGGELLVTALLDNVYYIDDASRYIDVSAYVKGLS